MRRNSWWIAIAVAVALSTAVFGQDGTSPLAYSSPLDSLTLDGLFPVRDADAIDSSMDVAKRWQEAGQRFLDHVGQFQSRVEGAAKLKQSELETVKTRKKQAKKTEDAAEKAAAAAQIQSDQKTVAMLQDLRELLSLEKRYAENLIAAGKALERVNELEREAAGRRAAAVEKRRSGGAAMQFGDMDPQVTEKQRTLVGAYREYGKRVQEMGGLLVEYSNQRDKILGAWKGK